MFTRKVRWKRKKRRVKKSQKKRQRQKIQVFSVILEPLCEKICLLGFQSRPDTNRVDLRLVFAYAKSEEELELETETGIYCNTYYITSILPAFK